MGQSFECYAMLFDHFLQSIKCDWIQSRKVASAVHITQNRFWHSASGFELNISFRWNIWEDESLTPKLCITNRIEVIGHCTMNPLQEPRRFEFCRLEIMRINALIEKVLEQLRKGRNITTSFGKRKEKKSWLIAGLYIPLSRARNKCRKEIVDTGRAYFAHFSQLCLSYMLRIVF